MCRAWPYQIWSQSWFGGRIFSDVYGSETVNTAYEMFVLHQEMLFMLIHIVLFYESIDKLTWLAHG